MPQSIAPVLASVFYAHQPVPGFATKPLRVTTKVLGRNKPRDYAEKVYQNRLLPVSMDSIVPEVQAWQWDFSAVMADLRASGAHRIRWNTKVVGVDWLHSYLHVMCGGTAEVIPYDHLITSAPMPVMLKLAEYSSNSTFPPFKSEPIWLRNIPGPEIGKLEDGHIEVTYCSDLDVLWYRRNQRGYNYEYEFTQRGYDKLGHEMRLGMVPLRPGKLQPHDHVLEIREWFKERSIHLVGRYAMWEHKWLSHQTWEQIAEMRL